MAVKCIFYDNNKTKNEERTFVLRVTTSSGSGIAETSAMPEPDDTVRMSTV